MSASEWISIVACAGHLSLALLVLLRGGSSPLALPIALLSLDLFGWNFAAFAYGHSGATVFRYFDRSLSPLTPPLALHVVCAFVGKARKLRYLLFAAYVAFAALVFRIDERDWGSLFLSGIAITMVPALTLLLVHLWRTDDPLERVRTQLILAAALIGTILGSADLWDARVPVPIPPIGSLATFVSTALVATVALRLKLFGKELSPYVMFYAGALAVLAVVVYLGIFEWLGGRSVVALGAITALFAVAIIFRDVRYAQVIRHAREEQLVTMGRFSRQLAHDLKNPLAALSGAIQFLLRERAAGRPLDANAHFLEMMAEQSTRLRGVIDDYERIARVEPVCLPIAVNELVRAVLLLQPFAAREGIEVKAQLADDLPECSADRDLVATALENLLRNAFEAMPAGGTVTVRTERIAGSGPRVSISVEDQGVGMDPREQSRAFDDFFTTKDGGTGHGLAFVRRVAHAHGGHVSLSSRVGRGTLVSFHIPAKGE
jgi:signal transduction histidine kinase